MTILVTGAGGFIGGHLVGELLRRGHETLAVDVKRPSDWWQWHGDAHSFNIDLRVPYHCESLFSHYPVTAVYNLAADMGGIGYIESHRVACALGVRLNANLIEAAEAAGVQRYFFASSACVYPTPRQHADAGPLREYEAYPAMPEDGYGWEKLYSERLCQHFGEETELKTRVARYHNIFGPHGTWRGGREKAPAAICRKVAEVVLYGRNEIEIWGDGEQIRSFCYVDDCIEGTIRIMESDVAEPLNLGSSYAVTINQLVDIVEAIAGVKRKRIYKPSAPKGVSARNSDNTLIQKRLGWRPSIPLETGLERTYAWIYDQVKSCA